MTLVMAPPVFIKWFSEIGLADAPLVGGKNASLGEMVQELSAKGVNVPPGFAITAEAYKHFLTTAGVDEEVEQIISGLNTKDLDELRRRGAAIRHLITSTPLPLMLEHAIIAAYEKLSAIAGHPADVAVRSSATAEDLPDASFAGQQETYLNVQGTAALLHAVRQCFASLFTDRGERTTSEFPFLLTSGRSLHQFNCGTMTSRSRTAKLRLTDTLDILALDALRLGLADGEQVRLSSRYGQCVIPVRFDPSLMPGVVFATFHDPAVFLNRVIGPAKDPATHTPQYKLTAVRIDRIRSGTRTIRSTS